MKRWCSLCQYWEWWMWRLWFCSPSLISHILNEVIKAASAVIWKVKSRLMKKRKATKGIEKRFNNIFLHNPITGTDSGIIVIMRNISIIIIITRYYHQSSSSSSSIIDHNHCHRHHHQTYHRGVQVGGFWSFLWHRGLKHRWLNRGVEHRWWRQCWLMKMIEQGSD